MHFLHDFTVGFHLRNIDTHHVPLPLILAVKIWQLRSRNCEIYWPHLCSQCPTRPCGCHNKGRPRPPRLADGPDSGRRLLSLRCCSLPQPDQLQLRFRAREACDPWFWEWPNAWTLIESKVIIISSPAVQSYSSLHWEQLMH